MIFRSQGDPGDLLALYDRTVAVGGDPGAAAAGCRSGCACPWPCAGDRALVLLRRRWPVAVLLASAAILQVYNLFDCPGSVSRGAALGGAGYGLGGRPSGMGASADRFSFA